MIDARAASYDQHRKSPRHGSKIWRLQRALNALPLRMEPLPAWQPRATPFPWKPDRRSNHVPIRTAAMCRSYWSSCSPVGFGGGGSPAPVNSLFDLEWSEVNGVSSGDTHLIMTQILNQHIDICHVRNAAVKDDSSMII
jgi:hypothetical protein